MMIHTQHTSQMNAGVRLFTNDRVFIDPTAIDQLARVAAHPSCVQAVGLPDLHPGNGIPVGAAIVLRHEVWPQLLGTDIGCGVLLIPLNVTRVSLDKLERKIRRLFSTSFFDQWDMTHLGRAVWYRGAAALQTHADCPDGLRRLLEMVCQDYPPTEEPPPIESAATLTQCAGSLGTIGGGNHFVEIVKMNDMYDAPVCREMGLLPGRYGVLVHSGARRFGEMAAQRFENRPLREGEIADYLRAKNAAKQVARLNRVVLGYTVMVALGERNIKKVGRPLDLVHNDIESVTIAGQPAWLHRKGAAPIHAQAPSVVLGSRGACSYVLVGEQVEQSLWSVAHGAGRRICRADARARFKEKYRRRSLERTAFNGRVVCSDNRLLLEEHPEAYKPIHAVIDAICDAGVARRAAALEPVCTVKL